MKTVIRRGVFETNSSSIHSICIAKEPLPELEFPKKLMFKHGEFGWEYECYRSVEGKASYLYAAICEIYSDKYKCEEIKNKLYDILSKRGIEIEFEKEYTDEFGFKVESYIDHSWELKDWLDSLLHSKKRLLNFLFSEKSYIHTGNDNSGYYIIHENYPHEEYYKKN